MSAVRLLKIARCAAVLVTVAALPTGARVLRPWRASIARDPASIESTVASAAMSRDSLSEKVVARDPFRATRRPAVVAFDPNPAPPPSSEPPPPKPALAVTGIIWSREPSAVVEGFPGVEGARLVRVGEMVAGFRVRRITSQEVTVTGMDTTWILQVRTPW